MLKKLSVENYKGIKDRLTFSTETKESYDFNTGLVTDGRVNKAVIYGKNGKGKDTLLDAVTDITNNFIQKDYEDASVYLNMDSGKPYAHFDYTFDIPYGNDSIEVRYAYDKRSRDDITKERLFIDGKEMISCDHKNPGKSFARLRTKEGEKLPVPGSETPSYVAELSECKALASDMTNDVFLAFAGEVKRMRSFFFAGTIWGRNEEEEIIKTGRLQEFASYLDGFGIPCRLRLGGTDDSPQIIRVFENGEAEFMWTATEGMWVLTRLFCALPAIRESSIAVIHTVDAFLDTETAADVIRMLCGTEGTQIFMTADDTGLISNDLLRPDCYFDMDGRRVDSFAGLTDKKLRKAHNMEKMYRAGTFNG